MRSGANSAEHCESVAVAALGFCVAEELGAFHDDLLGTGLSIEEAHDFVEVLLERHGVLIVSWPGISAVCTPGGTISMTPTELSASWMRRLVVKECTAAFVALYVGAIGNGTNASAELTFMTAASFWVARWGSRA